MNQVITREEENKKRIQALFVDELPLWLSVVLYIVLPYLAFICIENFTHRAIEMKPMIQLTNYVVLLALQSLFLALFGTMRRAVTGMSIVSYVVGLINYLVVNFRGTPIMPWDYKSIGTAVSVVDNYSFPWTMNFFGSTALFLFLIWIARRMSGSIRFPVLRVLSVASMAAVFVGVISLINYPVYADMIKLDNTLFTPAYMYRHNGFGVAFIRNFTYLQVQKPEGYSIDRISSIMDEYMEDADSQLVSEGVIQRHENGVWLALRPDLVNQQLPIQGNELGNGLVNLQPSTDNYTQTDYVREKKGTPNVIIMMSEGFSELSVLAEYRTNTDYLPYFNSLNENVIRGYLHTSIIGGNTATSEFELLTSDSMAFLPAGSVAYQQFVVGEMPTLTSVLADQGYYSVAMHPYNAGGWDRDVVYPYFGFDKMKFAPQFENRERVRDYISDRSLFNEILLELDRVPAGRPAFLFTVSMQNHGGYSKRYEDFPVNIEILEDGNYAWVEHYLSLLQETDRAMEEFFTALENYYEDTIVLFFGDHQPNNSAVSALEQLPSYTMDPTARHIVPYLMWANFDIGAHEGRTTSLNYLAGDLLNAAGIETSPYMKFLDDLQEEIPVITGDYYILKDGTTVFFDERNALEDPVIDDLFNQYEVLQYNHLIDVKNRVDEIFSAAALD